jgi:hypothetical protein
MEVLQEEGFGVLGESHRDEAYCCTKAVYQNGDYRVNKIPKRRAKMTGDRNNSTSGS